MQFSARLVSPFVLCAALFSCPVATLAGSFTDLSASDPITPAAEYLREKGIVQGYSDGTFRPNTPITRAEALKLIVTPLASTGELAALTTSPYSDVPAGSWFLPSVEYARVTLKIINGPPQTMTFAPTKTITKAEFLKMFLLAQKVDVQGAFSEITSPLASDVTESTEWYYPFLRTALSSSMTAASVEGKLNPHVSLTRGHVALFMYRFFQYQEGKRTQALLSETESEVVNTINAINAKDGPRAEQAVARALLAARGALLKKPDEPVVKGAVKTAAAFKLIMESYKYGSAGRYEEAVTKAGEAWKMADEIAKASPTLTNIAVQVQQIAKVMADSARSKLAKP